MSQPPVLLVERQESRFVLTAAGKDFLCSPPFCNKKVKVVGIVGRYRTGKSFFLNELLGLKDKFELGHETDGKTRGIWLAACDDNDADCSILGLDSEGLWDAKNSSDVDTKIFLSVMLASSLLVINTEKTIDRQTFEQFSWVSQVLQLIDSHSSKQWAPDLLWLVRDALRLSAEYKDADDYFERQLGMLDSHGPGSSSASLAECLRACFRTRCCRLLPCPSLDTDRTAELQEDPSLRSEKFDTKLTDLVQETLQGLRIFCAPGCGTAENTVSSMPVELTGSMYASFLEQILEALNANARIEAPSLLAVVREREGARALASVTALLESSLEKVSLPVDDAQLKQELGAARAAAEEFVRKSCPRAFQLDFLDMVRLIVADEDISTRDDLVSKFRLALPQQSMEAKFSLRNEKKTLEVATGVCGDYEKSLATLLKDESIHSVQQFEQSIDDMLRKLMARVAGPKKSRDTANEKLQEIRHLACAAFSRQLEIRNEEQRRREAEELLRRQKLEAERRAAEQAAEEARRQKALVEAAQRQREEAARQQREQQAALEAERRRIEERQRQMQLQQLQQQQQRAEEARRQFAAMQIRQSSYCYGGSSGGGARQCAATTQKGHRCSRNVQAGSYYCWQHG